MYPGQITTECTKALVSLSGDVRASSVRMVCFNHRWLPEPDPQHEFLASAHGKKLREIEQALDDSGFQSRNIGDMEIDKAKRIISAFLDGVEW